MYKYIIKSLLREALLDEDYATHNEMKSLRDEVYMQICEKLAEVAFFKKSSNVFEDMMTIHYVFRKLKKDYTNLREFVDNFELEVVITGAGRAHGIFKPTSVESGTIGINFERNIDRAEEMLNKLVIPRADEPVTEELVTEMTRALYFATYDNNIASTILHELQHAYDAWRSKNKFVHNSKMGKFRNKQTSNDTDDEDKVVSYLKLQHEVNARFSQALEAITLFDYNFGKDPTKPFNKRTMRPFDTVLNDFKRNFNGWSVMSPSAQKRLVNRVSKMYHETSDKIK